MPKVKIVGKIDPETRAALIKLLQEAGFEIIEDSDEVAEHDAEDHLEEDGSCGKSVGSDYDDIVIVVLTPDLDSDEDFTRTMQECASSGNHVIGVWPKGSKPRDVPKSFDDYGGDTVIWDPKELKDACTKRRTEPVWSDTTGKPRSEPAMKRNKC